jgi:hypothetical protein
MAYEHDLRGDVIREVGFLAGVLVGAGGVLAFIEGESVFNGAILGALLFGTAWASAAYVVGPKNH